MVKNRHLSIIKLSHKNIEAQIFTKTTKNSKFGYINFPNESLDQKKYFKRVFGGRVGRDPRLKLTGSYKKKCNT